MEASNARRLQQDRGRDVDRAERAAARRGPRSTPPRVDALATQPATLSVSGTAAAALDTLRWLYLNASAPFDVATAPAPPDCAAATAGPVTLSGARTASITFATAGSALLCYTYGANAALPAAVAAGRGVAVPLDAQTAIIRQARGERVAKGEGRHTTQRFIEGRYVHRLEASVV